MRRAPANAGTEIAGWAIPGDGEQRFAPLEFTTRHPSLLNPSLPRVEMHVTAWAQKVGLLSAEAAEQARRERHIAFAGRVWPWAPPERLAELSRLALWMFAVDDRSDARGDDSGAVDTELQAMVRIVTCEQESVPEAVPGTVRVLAEVVPRLADHMGPAWSDRFRRHLAEWIQTNRDMIRRRAERSVPTPQAYVSWRRVSGAVGWCFDLTEYAQDAELPELVWSSPACRQLRHTAADIICWTNDLFSLGKELRTGETSNFVVILQHHHHLTLQDAVSEVNRRLSLRITELPAAMARLRTTAVAMNLTVQEQAAVDRYVDGIRAWTRGFVDYSQESARYAEAPVPPATEVPRR